MHISGFLMCVSMAVMDVLQVHCYTYDCYPNNSILVSGLPTDAATLYYFAIQESDGTNCNVTGSLSAGTAEISGCRKDEPIYFTFGSYSGMADNDIYGGQEVEIVNITCIEISDNGVTMSISNQLTAAIDFDEERTIAPQYDVTSALDPTSATVGEDVTWTITYPASYSLEITTCTAYPGTTVHATDSIVLISSWCTDITELITNFASNNDDTVATTTLKAFKFHNNDNVYLECDLLVCPPGSNSCTKSCAPQRKKREVDGHRGEFTKRIGKVLHIRSFESSAADLTPGCLFSILIVNLLSLL